VLARIRGPLELVAERIHETDRRPAPGYKLWTRPCLTARRVHELRILSWRAGRPRQGLRPRLHLSDDLCSPVGAIWPHLERDPGALHSTNLPAFGKHRAPQSGKPSGAASDNKLNRLGLTLVGTLVDEETGRTRGLPRPEVAFPSAHSDEAEAVEIDLAILATLDVPKEDRFAKAVVGRLRERAGARDGAGAVVEPVSRDVPGLACVHDVPSSHVSDPSTVSSWGGLGLAACALSRSGVLSSTSSVVRARRTFT